MEFLKKIQNLPEKKRKVIFWAFISILTIILIILYINIVKERIRNINIEEIKNEFPEWEPENIPELENFNLPEELEGLNNQEEVIE
ncbi:MAG: hypothetical protein ABH967_02670 [Patescibacteria group bacterium]